MYRFDLDMCRSSCFRTCMALALATIEDGCVGHFAARHLAKQENLSWAVAGRSLTCFDFLVGERRSAHLVWVCVG